MDTKNNYPILGIICIIAIVAVYGLTLTFATNVDKSESYNENVIGEAIKVAERNQLTKQVKKQTITIRTSSQGQEMSSTIYDPEYGNWLASAVNSGTFSEADIEIFSELLLDNQNDAIAQLILSCLENPDTCAQAMDQIQFYPNSATVSFDQSSNSIGLLNEEECDEEDQEDQAQCELEQLIAAIVEVEQPSEGGFDWSIPGDDGGVGFAPEGFTLQGQGILYTADNGYYVGGEINGPLNNPSGVTLTIGLNW